MPLSLITEQEYDDLVMRVGNLEAAKTKLEGENADLKRRVSALEGEPEPDPEPDPDPDPIPLPKVLTVGPGMGADFQSLEEIDSHALQAGTEIQVQYKSDIYKTKIGINKPGVKLIGQPGPNGERPILSGEVPSGESGSPIRPSFRVTVILTNRSGVSTARANSARPNMTT